MTKTVWDIIEESKDGFPYVSSEVQFKNLERILKEMDKSDVVSIYEEWGSKRGQLRGDEFEKLHVEDGGIVSSGGDGFYMDFANWLVAQGEGLFNKFQKEGHQAVIDYVEKHDITHDEYTFECMVYVFHDYIN